MRVERAKSEDANPNKAEANSRNTQLTNPSTLPSKTQESSSQGAFSKFLDEARRPSDSDRSEKKANESESDSSVKETADQGSEDADKVKDAKRQGEQSASGDGEGDDGGEGVGWTPAPLAGDLAGESKLSVPQARSILHVTDLERIVSAVRSDTLAGAKQVTIDLKNSVLDGLKIQITLTEQGNLKAEFIALNEQIKKQIDARKIELESILRDRSIKCSEVKVTVNVPDEAELAETKRHERSAFQS